MQHLFQESSTNAILKIGDYNLLKSYNTPQPIELFTFIWTKEQALKIKVDGQPIVVEPNQIIALSPHQYLEVESTANSVVYQFNQEFYCIQKHDNQVSCNGILFFANTSLPKINVTSEEQQKFTTLHQVFIEEIGTKDAIQAEMLRMLLTRFIIKVTRLVKKQYPNDLSQTVKIDLLREFNMLVEKHFREDHQVASYAARMHKSAKTLSNSFAAYEKSPLQIIHDRITLEAKRQLYYTDMTSKEIAFNLGFDDPSHFSRLFKKQTGQSPTVFKKQLSAVAV